MLPQGVYVPKMVAELTTERVLVMEWVQGNRLRSAGNLREGDGGPSSDLSMVDIGVQCSLEQMLEVGFYHSDPHPGNLMRTPDGRLAYIDFGMMGQINPDIRRWGWIIFSASTFLTDYKGCSCPGRSRVSLQRTGYPSVSAQAVG